MNKHAARCVAEGVSEQGHVRPDNEDYLILNETSWLVADGMGGHEGGGTASTVAAHAASACWQHSDGSTGSLQHCFDVAHTSIRDLGAQSGFTDMGTTLVLAHLDSTRSCFTWPGSETAVPTCSPTTD